MELLDKVRRLAPATLPLLGTGAAVGAAALVVAARARQAERRHPPHGQFIDAGGVRLHYVERGHGQPVVCIHGLGGLIQDFELSGVPDAAAQRYRVIVLDRPGAGHSERPRDRSWSVEAQAGLLCDALFRLGVERPIIVGHSMGALIALAMGLQRPEQIGALVLLAGYYFPTPKPSLLPFAVNGMPVVGDVLRYTVSPWLSLLAAPAFFTRAFAPYAVPETMQAFPLSLALRPSQLRATGEDAATLTPGAAALSGRYRELRLPAVIVAGTGDRLVDTETHSVRLHEELSASELYLAGDAGHMVHHVSPRHVLWAIDRAAHRLRRASTAA